MIPAPYYISLPSEEKGPGILVLHAWWGLTNFTKEFCDRLSHEGFVVIAPDLYHGKIAKTVAEAERLRGKMNRTQAQADILSALTALRAHPNLSRPQVGLIGFSLGAYLGLGIAAENPADIQAVTLFYGARNIEFLASRAAFLGHFAQTDPYTSISSVEKLEKDLRKAGRQVQFYTYPGTGHWFFENDRPDAFHPAAAELAWQRTLEFLQKELAG